MDSHFILLAEFFHDEKSDGHRVTILTVMADSSQEVNANTSAYMYVYTINSSNTIVVMSPITLLEQ